MKDSNSTYLPMVRLTAGLLAFLGWAVLALQLWLTLTNGFSGARPTDQIIVNFFSFFTVLSNLLVAIIFTWFAIAPPGAPATLQAAVAAYIAVVAIGYSLLLRSAWDPDGLQKIVDVMLHDILPLLYVIFWIAFCRQLRALPRSHAYFWLTGPFAYLVYTMVRGHKTGWYPYHFLNPSIVGYPIVICAIVGFLVAFLLFGLGAARLTRRTASQDSKTAPPSWL
ncbi:MAG TPA: Pr6Pr family membrane protein [Edaphobacter sp.]